MITNEKLIFYFVISEYELNYLPYFKTICVKRRDANNDVTDLKLIVIIMIMIKTQYKRIRFQKH